MLMIKRLELNKSAIAMYLSALSKGIETTCSFGLCHTDKFKDKKIMQDCDCNREVWYARLWKANKNVGQLKSVRATMLK
jgi:hypothetical protein